MKLQTALRVDWPLLGALLTIIGIGIINLYSATHASYPNIYRQHLTWLLMGGVVFSAVAVIDYRRLTAIATPLYLGGVAALVLVLLVGKNVHGSTRWLQFFGYTVQPSELMKVVLIVTVAQALGRPPTEGSPLKDLTSPVLLTLLPVALILREPDLGTSLLICLVILTVLVLARLTIRAIIVLVAASIVAAPLTWIYGLKEYQRLRIITFLNPHSDPAGAGWHAQQALVAVGSGGWTGRGYMQGTQTQLHFLPEQWTDFPFAVWAEEWGLLGSLILIGAYLIVIARALLLSSLARDRFGTLICAGMAALFFWHVIINIAMVTGLMPVVGVTLPLFSYGGSSVLTFMIGSGLIMSVAMRRHAL